MLPKKLRLKLKLLVSSQAVTGKINVAVYHDWCYPRRWGIHATYWKLTRDIAWASKKKRNWERIDVIQAALKILIVRYNNRGQPPHNRLFVTILAWSRLCHGHIFTFLLDMRYTRIVRWKTQYNIYKTDSSIFNFKLI